MKIISNTGPLIGLAKIDCLSILKMIASEVLIPPMVHRELVKAGHIPISAMSDLALVYDRQAFLQGNDGNADVTVF
jgi:predicted nucleic acid-binding protein